MNDWTQRLSDDPIPWLLESNPWTRYRTLTDLLEQPENSVDVKRSKSDLLEHEDIQKLIAGLNEWFPESITRHNKPDLSHYVFAMLVDFGLNASDNALKKIAATVMSKTSEGQFAVRQTLPDKGGFTKAEPDADEWHALPCDSPLILSTLVNAGFADKSIDKAVDQLMEYWKADTGWFCHFFFVEGQHKKLQVACPMAGLFALQAFSQIIRAGRGVDREVVEKAYKPIQFHRDYGKSIYYFGRSKKFWTFKYPYVWYNALYLADILTRFDSLKRLPLTRELIDWIEKAQDENGRFNPTSMFRAYKNWDFADKKQASPWMTYLCCRILKRFYAERLVSV